MAIKHVVTEGLGFPPVNFVVTDGFGDYAEDGDGSADSTANWAAVGRRARRKRKRTLIEG